jgi:Trk K+ transport system NAD-binding subunit
MPFRTRRAVYYLALVVGTTAAFTVAYNTGMAVWEGRPQPLYRSFGVVVQTFTTTGYGEDAPWTTPQMYGLVVVMMLSGLGLILTAVDVFAVPWLRGVLTPAAPAAADDADGHVVVCGYTPRTEAFIGELDARDHEYVLVESDAERARELHEAEHRVVHGDPEAPETLANARIDASIAVVIDVADDTNASIALAARDVDPECQVVTLVEDVSLARYHRAAGASDVLSPRQLLGESLAEEIPTAVTTRVDEGVTLGESFDLVEVTVSEDSDHSGRSFAEAGLRERFGVNVIGVWSDGEFDAPVSPDDELVAGARLLVAGESGRIDALRDVIGTTVREFAPRRILLAGYGDSGRAAQQALSETNSRLSVLDVDPADGVDVTGDVRDPELLKTAGIEEASTLLLTVGDDTTAIFTTLIARELNPELRIVVRANEGENVQKLYRAGADYVQSLATVSGRMLVSTVLEDEEVLVYDNQISVVRRPAGDLEGQTLVDAAVRTETGATVVAAVRDGETVTEFDPAAFTFQADDEVIVAGTDESVSRFEQRFGD